MATTRTSPRKNKPTRKRHPRTGQKLKAEFVDEQMRAGRSKRQAEATYRMLRGSAKHRRQYALNPHKKPRIGRGVRAQWSPIMQAWVVRPYNPEWQPAVVDAAPVLRVINTDAELDDYMRDYQRNPVPTGDDVEINIANPSDAEFFQDNRYIREGPLFKLWFGAYGSTHVYVWADGFESAFEGAVEWLDDEGLCGVFVTLDESDIRDAAEEHELDGDDILARMKGGDWDEEVSMVMQDAETDLTMIGHTSLTNCEKQLGGGPLYIPSWEWGVEEVIDKKERQLVYDASLDRDEDTTR